MSEPNLFMLVSQMEGQLMGYWSFRARDELAIARYLLHDPWEYQDVFWALRISVQEVETLSPEGLLHAIRDSYWNPHVRAVLYLLPIVQPADCDSPKPIELVPRVAPAG